MNLKEELDSYRIDFNIWEKIPCTKQESQKYKKILAEGGTLPKWIYREEYEEGLSTEEFFNIHKSNLSEEEIKEYLMYKKLSMIRTIKNCVVFFTVLTVIGLIAYLLLSLNAIH